MKKRVLLMLTVLTASAGVMIGCSPKPQQDTNEEIIQEGEVIQEDNAEDGKQQMTEEGEVSEVKGTMEEIKDFMFIVTDDDNAGYAFSFEEKPEGLDELAVVDKVIVKYTGTISEFDPFMGEIVSVEKID